jgi:hypothetical protein
LTFVHDPRSHKRAALAPASFAFASSTTSWRGLRCRTKLPETRSGLAFPPIS